MDCADEVDLDSYANLDEYEVIPRPQELLKTNLLSISSMEKHAKELSLRKKLLLKKGMLASKEKLLSLSKDEKKNMAKVKSRSSSRSPSKISNKTKKNQELEQKFALFVQKAKKNLKKNSSRSEVSKSTKDDSEKIKPSPSREDISKQELQFFKSMEECAVTDQDRYEVLNARDNYLRLKELKKGESKVKKVSGTCPDMCPEKERYSRIAKNCLAIFETKMAFDPMSSSKDVDHCYMVKEYSRSSADQQEPLPHELRPVSVLKFTMDYLVCNVVGRKNMNISIADWYDFIWNRTRSIRKDITQQQLCDVECVEILEKCARFHILCAELLSEEDAATFDPKINNENLTKCLQTLKHMYHDLQTRGVECPNEAEFRAYDILLSLTEGETLRLVKDIRKEVINSPQVKKAFEAALAFKSNNYVRFFKLMEEGTYLDCCILHRYIPEARVRAMLVIERAYSMPNNPTMLPLMRLVKDLKFENMVDAASFCEWHGLTVDETHVTIQRQTFQKPSSMYPVARATSLVGNKLQTSLGEIINNGPLPENPLHWYQPHNSFSEEGLLLNKFSVSDSFERGKDDMQNMDNVDLNVTINPIESIKSPVFEETRIEQELSKLEQENFSMPLTKIPSVSNLTSENIFFGHSKNKINKCSGDIKPESKKTTNTSLFSQRSPTVTTQFVTRKPLPSATIATNETKNSFKASMFQGSVAGNLPSKSSAFFSTSTCLSSGFSVGSRTEQNLSSLKKATKTDSILPSSQTLNSSASENEVSGKSEFTSSFKQSKIQDDFVESEESMDQGIGSETDVNEKEKEAFYDDNSNVSLHEKEVTSLSLALEDEETLKKLREEKMREIITDVSDEVYTECIEVLSTEISRSTIKEEWDKKLEYEDALEKVRTVLARKAIYKWRLFCERKKQRRVFQSTEPLSPWIPMLMNTEYVSSGASSPFSVYKKHCSLSHLADYKLKHKDKNPGWEPFTSSQIDLLNRLPAFPPAYLKKVGINRFFKLCIIFAAYPNYSISSFIDWMCKKFKLSALSENIEKKSHLLSFYSLNGGKTLMCIQAIILEKDTVVKNIHCLNGLSAMMLCIPNRFSDSMAFSSILEQFKTILGEKYHLLPFPLVTFLLESTGKYNVVNQLTSFLDDRLYSGNVFSAVERKELSNPVDYLSNSNEVLNAVKWLIKNQEQVPVVLNSCLRNYLEDSFASVFNTLFWKLSLQEFKPLFQMPQKIISFYNKLLECRASLLCSDFLMAVSKWWPPQELFTLQPEYRFIDVSFQQKSAELMKNLCLPEFVGDPCSLKDLWLYVNKIADSVDAGKEALFLSVQSILRISTEVDWPSIISKCAFFILCHYCSRLGSGVNEDVFYTQADLKYINFDSFWQTLLFSLKDHHPLSKRKMPESEGDEDSFKRNKTMLVEECSKTEEKDQCAAAASEIPSIVSNRVDNLLSSLKCALKKQKEESDRFTLKLNESFFHQSYAPEITMEDEDPAFNFQAYKKLDLDFSKYDIEKDCLIEKFDDKNDRIERWKAAKLSHTQESIFEANRNNDSDVVQKLLGRKLPPPVTSPSSLSDQLLELKYNIQRNNILEDNLGILLKL